MTMRLKYVMFRIKGTPSQAPRYTFQLFPEMDVHKLVQRAMEEHHAIEPMCAVSAGFVRLRVVNLLPYLECHGESESMSMKAHPDDTSIMMTYDYRYGLGFDPRREIEG